jgi:hypothetical protein
VSWLFFGVFQALLNGHGFNLGRLIPIPADDDGVSPKHLPGYPAEFCYRQPPLLKTANV